LPPGVSWENQVRVTGAANQPTYVSRTNTVTWDLGTLTGGTGVSLPKAEADFQVSITPSVNQVGQSVTVIKNVRFDGADAYTQEKISRSVSDITTDNISDAQASGNVQQ